MVLSYELVFLFMFIVLVKLLINCEQQREALPSCEPTVMKLHETSTERCTHTTCFISPQIILSSYSNCKVNDIRFRHKELGEKRKNMGLDERQTGNKPLTYCFYLSSRGQSCNLMLGFYLLFSSDILVLPADIYAVSLSIQLAGF